MPEIPIGTVPEIPYSVRRSTRARRVRVRVDGERGVEVVLPARAPAQAAGAAVVELRPWIERRLRELERARRELARRGETVPYLGHRLVLEPEAGRQRVVRRDERLLVPEGDPRPALERFYRRSARAEVGERLDRACALTGKVYRGLAIRGQRTRWASCSASGWMSFNWRLLLAPERVLEYVIWHEVCHLEIADHSPRFWRLLEERRPGYREERRWLTENGATLVL